MRLLSKACTEREITSRAPMITVIYAIFACGTIATL